MDLIIVGIDSNTDLLKQLIQVAELNKLSVHDVVAAYNQRNETTSFDQQILPHLFFDIKAQKEVEETEIPSDYKSVKERNKFFEHPRRK